MNRYFKYLLAFTILFSINQLVIKYHICEDWNGDSWVLGYYLGLTTYLLNGWLVKKEPNK